MQKVQSSCKFRILDIVFESSKRIAASYKKLPSEMCCNTSDENCMTGNCKDCTDDVSDIVPLAFSFDKQIEWKQLLRTRTRGRLKFQWITYKINRGPSRYIHLLKWFRRITSIKPNSTCTPTRRQFYKLILWKISELWPRMKSSLPIGPIRKLLCLPLAYGFRVGPSKQ